MRNLFDVDQIQGNVMSDTNLNQDTVLK
ncbi:MAG: hypothetical protein RL183_222, partial [Pseudomonadota bacterium]